MQLLCPDLPSDVTAWHTLKVLRDSCDEIHVFCKQVSRLLVDCRMCAVRDMFEAAGPTIVPQFHAVAAVWHCRWLLWADCMDNHSQEDV